MTEAERSQRWLKDYGPKAPNDEPLFRLVWSDTATEYRKGTFSDFSGDIYLRTVTEVRQTKKYNYINERWVLEMWTPPEVSASPELPESFKGGYEPVWVFEDNKGNYLAPIVKAVQFLVKYSMQAPTLTPQERAAELTGDEYKGMMDILDRQVDTISEIGLALRTGGAVGYRGVK